MHRIRSAHLDETLRIDVGLPLGYEASSKTYPAVYLLDGHWYFPEVFQTATSMGAAAEMPPVLIIGIGYEPASLDRKAEQHRISELRCRDLTPTCDATDWWRIAGADGPLLRNFETGGAPAFERAIETEIKVYIRKRYRVRSTDECLAGFSLGGLFALNVLFSRPDRFRRYVAGSPSLWWDDGVIFDGIPPITRSKPGRKRHLFVSVGQLEGRGAARRARMIENVRRLERRLSPGKRRGLNCHFAYFEGDTHATSAGRAFAHGLKAVFADGMRTRVGGSGRR